MASKGQVVEFSKGKGRPRLPGSSSASGTFPHAGWEAPEPRPAPSSLKTGTQLGLWSPCFVMDSSVLSGLVSDLSSGACPPSLCDSGCSEHSCVPAGSVKVLREPSCFSDYISVSVCQWEMDSPTNCSAELRLSYQLNFIESE